MSCDRHRTSTPTEIFLGLGTGVFSASELSWTAKFSHGWFALPLEDGVKRELGTGKGFIVVLPVNDDATAGMWHVNLTEDWFITDVSESVGASGELVHVQISQFCTSRYQQYGSSNPSELRTPLCIQIALDQQYRDAPRDRLATVVMRSIIDDLSEATGPYSKLLYPSDEMDLQCKLITGIYGEDTVVLANDWFVLPMRKILLSETAVLCNDDNRHDHFSRGDVTPQVTWIATAIHNLMLKHSKVTVAFCNRLSERSTQCMIDDIDVIRAKLLCWLSCKHGHTSEAEWGSDEFRGVISDWCRVGSETASVSSTSVPVPVRRNLCRPDVAVPTRVPGSNAVEATLPSRANELLIDSPVRAKPQTARYIPPGARDATVDPQCFKGGTIPLPRSLQGSWLLCPLMTALAVCDFQNVINIASLSLLLMSINETVVTTIDVLRDVLTFARNYTIGELFPVFNEMGTRFMVPDERLGTDPRGVTTCIRRHYDSKVQERWADGLQCCWMRDCLPHVPVMTAILTAASRPSSLKSKMVEWAKYLNSLEVLPPTRTDRPDPTFRMLNPPALNMSTDGLALPDQPSESRPSWAAEDDLEEDCPCPQAPMPAAEPRPVRRLELSGTGAVQATKLPKATVPKIDIADDHQTTGGRTTRVELDRSIEERHRALSSVGAKVSSITSLRNILEGMACGLESISRLLCGAHRSTYPLKPVLRSNSNDGSPAAAMDVIEFCPQAIVAFEGSVYAVNAATAAAELASPEFLSKATDRGLTTSNYPCVNGVGPVEVVLQGLMSATAHIVVSYQSDRSVRALLDPSDPLQTYVLASRAMVRDTPIRLAWYGWSQSLSGDPRLIDLAEPCYNKERCLNDAEWEACQEFCSTIRYGVKGDPYCPMSTPGSSFRYDCSDQRVMSPKEKHLLLLKARCTVHPSEILINYEGTGLFTELCSDELVRYNWNL